MSEIINLEMQIAKKIMIIKNELVTISPKYEIIGFRVSAKLYQRLFESNAKHRMDFRGIIAGLTMYPSFTMEEGKIDFIIRAREDDSIE